MTTNELNLFGWLEDDELVHIIKMFELTKGDVDDEELHQRLWQKAIEELEERMAMEAVTGRQSRMDYQREDQDEFSEEDEIHELAKQIREETENIPVPLSASIGHSHPVAVIRHG